jgi:hypothetical protein
VATEDTIYLFGGIDIDGNRNNDLYALDLNEMVWRKVLGEGKLHN